MNFEDNKNSNNITSGVFITFEGGEGGGKTTQIKKLSEFLTNKKVKHICTREIGGTPLAEQIQKCIMESDSMTPEEEYNLINVARYDHMKTVMIVALTNMIWVICDRFVDSTACYQTISSNITQEDVYKRHNTLSDGLLGEGKSLWPDITFFLDIPPEKGLNRAKLRGNTNKFEDKRTLEYHQTVYKNFKSLQNSKFAKDRLITINCLDDNNNERSEEEIYQEIISYIQHYLSDNIDNTQEDVDNIDTIREMGNTA